MKGLMWCSEMLIIKMEKLHELVQQSQTQKNSRSCTCVIDGNLFYKFWWYVSSVWVIIWFRKKYLIMYHVWWCSSQMTTEVVYCGTLAFFVYFFKIRTKKVKQIKKKLKFGFSKSLLPETDKLQMPSSSLWLAYAKSCLRRKLQHHKDVEASHPSFGMAGVRALIHRLSPHWSYGLAGISTEGEVTSPEDPRLFDKSVAHFHFVPVQKKNKMSC